jgi:hypothetical protein
MISKEGLQGILYSREPWRLHLIGGYQAIFQGRHANHALQLIDGLWQCDCAAWHRCVVISGEGSCRHTIALLRILTAMDEGTALVCQAELIQ